MLILVSGAKMFMLQDIQNPRKTYRGSNFLSLDEYLSLARRMIGKFTSVTYRMTLLNNDDAIGYVAHQIMRADWEYEASRSVSPGTWRGYKAKRAIQKFIRVSKSGKNKSAISLDDMNLHAVIHSPEHINNEDREHINVLLSELFDNLSNSQRNCIVLYYLEGLTQAEVATQLGISHQCVQQTLRRGMSILRKIAHDNNRVSHSHH